jgi:hypothetical protein
MASVGFLVGWSLWYFSPALFGAAEPWDGDLFAYWGILLVTAASCAALAPRFVGLSIATIYLGQVVGCHLVLQKGPLIVPPIVSIALFGMIPVVGGATLGWLLTRSWSSARLRGKSLLMCGIL